jgi:hypothetical protein
MQRNNQAYTFKRAWLLLFAMEPKSRIKSWKSWFIFNLQKININQYCESIRGNEIIMIRTGDILQELMATFNGNFYHMGKKVYSEDFVHT